MILGLNPEQFSVLVSVFEPLFVCAAAVFFLTSAIALVTVRRYQADQKGFDARSISTDRTNGRRERDFERSRTKRGSFGPPPETILPEQLGRSDADSAGRTVAPQINNHPQPYQSKLRLLATITHYAPQLGLLGSVVCSAVGLGRLYFSGNPLGISAVAGAIWLVLFAISLAVMVAIPTFLAHGWLENRIARQHGATTDHMVALAGNRSPDRL